MNGHTITTQDIQAILDEHRGLHYHGNSHYCGPDLAGRNELLTPDSVATIGRVCGWLNANIAHTKQVTRFCGSYGLKHIAERHIGEYVSNGQFIVAALLCGYGAALDYPNALFAMSVRSIKAARKTADVVGRDEVEELEGLEF